MFERTGRACPLSPLIGTATADEAALHFVFHKHIIIITIIIIIIITIIIIIIIIIIIDIIFVTFYRK